MPTHTATCTGRADTRRYFAAVIASKAGTDLGALAFPLVAVVTLAATPVDVGLLGAAGTAAFLVVGLPAGVWLDRLRRRAVMVIADLARGALLCAVPILWATGRLTMTHLWAVVLLTGVGTVFFDVGAQSYLPHLVGRAGLGRANAQLATIDSAGGIAGPAVAGGLAQVLGAPLVILVNAATHLWSAFWLLRVRRVEPPPPPARERHLRTEMAQGSAFVVRQPILRAVTISGALTNVALAATLAMLPIVVVRELGRSEAELGLFLGIGGVGSVVGAATSRLLARRLGEGRSLVVLGVAVGPAAALVPMAGAGVPLWLANVGWAVVGMKVGYDNALLVTFRQRITPDDLLGRVNATVRVVLTGAVSVGALLAGLVGEVAHPRAALWFAAITMSAVWIPVAASPLRGIGPLCPSEAPVATRSTI